MWIVPILALARAELCTEQADLSICSLQLPSKRHRSLRGMPVRINWIRSCFRHCVFVRLLKLTRGEYPHKRMLACTQALVEILRCFDSNLACAFL